MGDVLRHSPQYIITVALLTLLLTVFNVHLLLPFRIFVLVLTTVALVEIGRLLWLSGGKEKPRGGKSFVALIVFSGISLPALTLALQLLNYNQHHISHILLYSIAPVFILTTIAAVTMGMRVPASESASAHTGASSCALGTGLSLVYISVPVVILLYISELRYAPALLAIAMAGVGVFDTACYFIGKFFGKSTAGIFHMSPKKSLTGLLGGIVATIAIGVPLLNMLPQLFANQLFKILFLVLGLIIGAFYGDLFASVLKRTAGVKDSGKLVRGRGGVLDSIDSFLFAMPVFAGLYFVLY